MLPAGLACGQSKSQLQKAHTAFPSALIRLSYNHSHKKKLSWPSPGEPSAVPSTSRIARDKSLHLLCHTGTKCHLWPARSEGTQAGRQGTRAPCTWTRIGLAVLRTRGCTGSHTLVEHSRRWHGAGGPQGEGVIGGGLCLMQVTQHSPNLGPRESPGGDGWWEMARQEAFGKESVWCLSSCWSLASPSGFSLHASSFPASSAGSEHHVYNHSSSGTLPQVPHCWGSGSSSTPGLSVLLQHLREEGSEQKR